MPSIVSGVDKGIEIPGQVEFMNGVASTLGKIVKESSEQELETALKMPRNGINQVILPPFDHTNMSLEDLQHILKTLFQEAWNDSYGPPTVGMPGLPWLAIEQNPEDFYDLHQLCIPLRIPDTMRRDELEKLVDQLSGIPRESEDHFRFFSKEVIERKVRDRQVKEEEASRAGEEIEMDDISEETPVLLDDEGMVSVESSSIRACSPNGTASTGGWGYTDSDESSSMEAWTPKATTSTDGLRDNAIPSTTCLAAASPSSTQHGPFLQSSPASTAQDDCCVHTDSDESSSMKAWAPKVITSADGLRDNATSSTTYLTTTSPSSAQQHPFSQSSLAPTVQGNCHIYPNLNESSSMQDWAQRGTTASENGLGDSATPLTTYLTTTTPSSAQRHYISQSFLAHPVQGDHRIYNNSDKFLSMQAWARRDTTASADEFGDRVTSTTYSMATSPASAQHHDGPIYPNSIQQPLPTTMLRSSPSSLFGAVDPVYTVSENTRVSSPNTTHSIYWVNGGLWDTNLP
ncbi:hypothetical protein BT96DRAFT_1007617 [Gymnopus androsaceus JB14]|uniref:Uncharacterized protein n=1 Tax=Gymnopus androsaceus JB14 TaxID=1447944 RepID=A0A6A4GHR7_9AGAR|nr:hypothetical protein BT96DRAFT_1007617 [Gymnopus androsaceus JB14]